MEPAFVVHLVDEVRKRVDDVGERLVAAEVDFLGLDGLYEALGLGVVIGDAAALPPPHFARLPRARVRERGKGVARLIQLIPLRGAVPKQLDCLR